MTTRVRFSIYQYTLCIYRLCSDFEECTPNQSSLRLLDIYMYYEDHCKQKNTFLQSKDYVAKLIIKLFPSCNKKVVCRNGKRYIAYEGLRRSGVLDVGIEDPAIAVTADTFCIPTFYIRNQEHVNIFTTVNGSLSLTVKAGEVTEDIVTGLIDVQEHVTVDRPEKAMVQIVKSLRLCRGLPSNMGASNEEIWSSILQAERESRLRSPTCQSVIPWLSNSDVCGQCRTYYRKQMPKQNDEQTCRSFEAKDDAILETVIRKLKETGEKDALGRLIETQLRNQESDDKDPRHRRWTPETIQLCLTMYCR